jgi:hypothetical protein
MHAFKDSMWQEIYCSFAKFLATKRCLAPRNQECSDSDRMIGCLNQPSSQVRPDAKRVRRPGSLGAEKKLVPPGPGSLGAGERGRAVGCGQPYVISS